MSVLLRRLVPRIDPRALGLLRLLLTCALAARLWRGQLPVGDAPAALAFAWVALLGFALGLRTRLWHALLWLGLGLPPLLESASGTGQHFLALPHLLSVTLLLPLGGRFSIDALAASLGARREYVAADLADRDAMGAHRQPASAAAELLLWLDVLLGVVLVLGGLRPVVAPWLPPASLLLLALRPAMLDALASGLAPLLCSRRRLECFFDAGCGICFQAARLLARLDRFGHVEVLSNRDEERLPEGVDGELIERTIVVRDVERGTLYTRDRAIAVLCKALPLGWLPWLVLSLPGLHLAWGALYDLVARNRVRISVALGLAACEIPPPPVDADADESTR